MSKQNLGDPGHSSATSEEQEDIDAGNRRKVLRSVLRHVADGPSPTANLVLLADALGLGEELDELVGTSTERQQRLALVRGQLEALDTDERLPRLGNE